MKIYTKTGDAGKTTLVGGSKVSKSHIQIQACGSVDELNSWVGLLAEYTINERHKPVLREIQNMLFNIGANVMTEIDKHISKVPLIIESDIELLETEIDKMDALLEPMRSFILPGGHKEVAFAHVARTVCRRAERDLVLLFENEYPLSLVIKYVNRLSDYLFTLCRMMNKDLEVKEIPWTPRKNS